MAKNTKKQEVSADAIELVFDGVSWIDPNAPAFDFDSYDFDGVSWNLKKGLIPAATEQEVQLVDEKLN